MSDWELHYCAYDHRFGSVMIQMKHGDEMSPVFTLRGSDLLSQIPQHELRFLQKLATSSPEPYTGIEEVRQRVIRETDMSGKIILDCGGYDGWAAKKCLELGATRAIVLDNHQYEHYGWDEKKKDGVEYVRGDFMSFGPFHDHLEDKRSFNDRSFLTLPKPDTIIFFNVLYHLKNPWAGLDHLRSLLKPNGEMLLCTLFRYIDGAWMYLYEPRECNPDDETVYFGPSIEALERLLRLTGWKYEQVGLQDDRVVYRCKPVKDFVPALAEKGYAKS